MNFEHERVDELEGFDSWLQDAGGYDAFGGVTAADYDGDGHLEFTTGGRSDHGSGFLFLYDRDPETGTWTRHDVLDDFQITMGAAAADVDGDGRPEYVTGDYDHHLNVVDMAPDSDGFGEWYRATDAHTDHLHDILAADLDGDGADEIIVRAMREELVYYDVPEDPTDEWSQTVVSEDLRGDGTAVADLSQSDGLDIFTAEAWFENVHGDGSEWERHPLLPVEALEWHKYTRLAVADVDGDGALEAVVTESELDENARLAVLSQPADFDDPWAPEILVPASRDRRAMHSLDTADLDGDGVPEIVTVEMENKKTDGVTTTPLWSIFSYDDGWGSPEVILDENLGSHEAIVADITGDGHPDLVGKSYRANWVNGADGMNHVDVCWNRGSE